MDREVKRIIDAAQPGVLDVLSAYEIFEAPYMVAARFLRQDVVIISGTSSAPPTRQKTGGKST